MRAYAVLLLLHLRSYWIQKVTMIGDTIGIFFLSAEKRKELRGLKDGKFVYLLLGIFKFNSRMNF